MSTPHASYALLQQLQRCVGEANVLTDAHSLALAATDVYESGPTPMAVVRPESVEQLASSVRAATSQGYAIAPRGGGLSYTAGYIPQQARTVSFDLSGLNRIVSIDADDMTITVEAGVTWDQIQQALKPLGLRLGFFGTLSGKGATVGGGLSHGALFFGSARYGSAAELVLAMDVVCADGSILSTGQGALALPSKPALRGFGPDLTGLFVHDGGALGLKARATLRLIAAPRHTDFASYSYREFRDAGAALSAIAREDLAEDVYVLDPASTDHLDLSLADKARSAAAVVRDATGPTGAVKSLASMAAAGTSFVPKGHYSLHVTAAGRSASGVQEDLDRAGELALALGGKPVAPTIPRVTRADPFANLNGVVGPDGGRWTALNAKVAHSEADTLIEAFDALLAQHRERMAEHGVTVTLLASALANHCFSFECVFHWRDSWLPIHREVAEPAHLKRFNEADANLAAREVVDRLRCETVELFRRLGAASNQIGRTYPYLSALAPEPSDLLLALKRHLDPDGLLNPGVLGFPVRADKEQNNERSV